MSSRVLEVLVGCAKCPPEAPAAGRLFVKVRGGDLLCAAHWKAAGSPWPTGPALSPAELWELETRTRERMTRRGGADRHLVRKGSA